MLKKVPYIFQNGAIFTDLGSEMYKTVLDQLMPKMWFASKVRYSLDKIYRRPACQRETHFYSMNQFLPNRKRLVVIDVDAPNQNGLEYDLEWMAILRATNRFVSIEREPNYELPELTTPIEADLNEEKELIRPAFKGNLKVPKNFAIDLPIKSVARITLKDTDPQRELNYISKQTRSFCSLLSITDPNQLLIDLVDEKKKSGGFSLKSFKSKCVKRATHLADSLRAKFQKTKKADP